MPRGCHPCRGRAPPAGRWRRSPRRRWSHRQRSETRSWLTPCGSLAPRLIALANRLAPLAEESTPGCMTFYGRTRVLPPALPVVRRGCLHADARTWHREPSVERRYATRLILRDSVAQFLVLCGAGESAEVGCVGASEG